MVTEEDIQSLEVILIDNMNYMKFRFPDMMAFLNSMTLSQAHKYDISEEHFNEIIDHLKVLYKRGLENKEKIGD